MAWPPSAAGFGLRIGQRRRGSRRAASGVEVSSSPDARRAAFLARYGPLVAILAVLVLLMTGVWLLGQGSYDRETAHNDWLPLTFLMAGWILGRLHDDRRKR